MNTSFIIVSWNTSDLTLRCIQSIYEKETSGFEVIVVDNDSSDDTVKKIKNNYPDVRLIENDHNEGYAYANNQGIVSAKGELIVLLNSDTEIITNNPMQIIKKYFNTNASAGIVGACLLYPNGKIQSCGRAFISLVSLIKSQLLFSGSFRIKKSILNKEPMIVDYVDGAFLAIRKKVIDQIGLLNTDYFMYAEDMEWCASAKDAGWQTVVLPDLKVQHLHAASSKKIFKKILVYNAINQCRFIFKQYSMSHAYVSFCVLILGMIIRIPLSVIRRNGLAKNYTAASLKCIDVLPVFHNLVTGELDEKSCL